MPYYPQIGDVLEARLVSYTPTQIAINTIHFRRTNVIPVGTGADLLEIAEFLDTNLQAAYKALMSSSAKWRGVGVSKIDPPRTIEYSTIAHDGAGTISADLLPGQVTYVVQKRTLLAGVENRGRIFPGFPPETANDANGFMASAYAATVAALATLLNDYCLPTGVTGATGDTDIRAILKHSGGFTWTDLDNIIGTDKWATQRRRSQSGRTNVLPF